MASFPSSGSQGVLFHFLALCAWIGHAVARHPRVSQWIATSALSLLVAGGAAIGLSRSESALARSRPAMDRQWLIDSFPAYLRPTIRTVVQEENAPVSAKLDTMEEKNREVRRFIVSTGEYQRWKRLRDLRRREEERINAEAERGFVGSTYPGEYLEETPRTERTP
jgi:hypothetical protein